MNSVVGILIVGAVTVGIVRPNYVLYHDTILYEGSVCNLATGGKGYCTLRNNCSTYLENHRQVHVCGFKKNEEIICCPNINYTGPYPSLVQGCADRSRRIEDALKADEETTRRCQEEMMALSKYFRNVSHVFISTDREIKDICAQEANLVADTDNERQIYKIKCGPYYRSSVAVSPASYTPSVIIEHPHMAALGWTSSEGKVAWNCGGSLIHRSFVLTAAHCIENIGKPPDVIRVGDVDLNVEADNRISVDYTIEQIFVHDKYKSPAYYNDIAILKVKKTPQYRYKIRPLPACVWTEDQLPSEKLLMMGYGASGFGKAYIEKLYEGTLTVISNEECNGIYTTVDSLPNGIVESQVCARDPEKVFDTCEGDSGGPLQFNAADKYKTPYIVGITSFGFLCLDGNPGVYTRISDFLPWIEDIISTNM